MSLPTTIRFASDDKRTSRSNASARFRHFMPSLIVVAALCVLLMCAGSSALAFGVSQTDAAEHTPNSTDSGTGKPVDAVVIAQTLSRTGHSLQSLGADAITFTCERIGTIYFEGNVRFTSRDIYNASDGHIAYCMDPGRASPDGGWDYTQVDLSNLTRNTLFFGYDGTSTSVAMVQSITGDYSLSDIECRVATQMAVYEANADDAYNVYHAYFPGIDGLVVVDERGNNVRSAARAIYDHACAGLPSVQIDGSDTTGTLMNIQGTNYVQYGSYRYRTDWPIYDAEINISNATGYYVGDENGNRLGVPVESQNFFVYIPLDGISSSTTPLLTVSIKYRAKQTYLCWVAQDTGAQDMIYGYDPVEARASATYNLNYSNLTLRKIDAHTGQGLSGVLITLKTPDDKTVVARGVTGNDGSCTIPVLPAGTYHIYETNPDGSYMNLAQSVGNGKEYIVATVGNGTNTYVLKNYQDIGLIVYKYDGDSLQDSDFICTICGGNYVVSARDNCLICAICGDTAAIVAEPIGGTQFTLYRQISATQANDLLSDQYMVDAQGIYWRTIGTVSTDATGRAIFAPSLIDSFGTYRVKETVQTDSSPEGWMLPHDSGANDYYDFTVDASTYSSPELYFTFVDYRYRSIEVNKVDQQTGKAVAETEYTLYQWNNPNNEYARPIECGGADTAGSWNTRATGITDENGVCSFGGLVFGYYRVTETKPNRSYAYGNESTESSAQSYYFTVDNTRQKQTQTWKNLAINLNCHVYEKTIGLTSVAFRSLANQVISYNNTQDGVQEKYRYDVSFDNGTTNVRADQYSVIDTFGFTSYGIRLSDLYTPQTINDTDGVYNLWYRTNKTDDAVVYSAASAAMNRVRNTHQAQEYPSSSPVETIRASKDSDQTMTLGDGSDRIPTTGYKLWTQNLSCLTRTHLLVRELNLADDEYVTSIFLEYGSVEKSFTTTAPLSYLVYASTALSNEQSEVVIPDTVTSHITRNYIKNDESAPLPAQCIGLYDDDRAQVETRVIDTFSYDEEESTIRLEGLPHTQDSGLPWWLFALTGIGVITVIGGIIFIKRQRNIAKRIPDTI